MSIIRALLAAGLTLGLNTHAAATAEPTCSILDVSIADPESPSPVELRQVAAAARTAIAAQHVKHADAFPAQSDGVVGMMKGGGLKTVGYSKHGHANEPKTFQDCLDACYDDCKCLGFHWSEKLARCGLKADGNIPVSVDNRYQKTFRSFKRLEVTGCTPATTDAGTTTAEPTTTTSTPATTTSSTSTTTAEPTTLGYCSYRNGTLFTFVEAVFQFTNDTADGPNGAACAINTFDASAVTTMNQLFERRHIFNQNINNWNTGAVATMQGTFATAVAFNQSLNNWNTGAVTDMYYMFLEAAAFNQNINAWSTGAVVSMVSMFLDAVAFNQNINNWNTSAVVRMQYMFSNAAAFNQNINNWNTGAVTDMNQLFAEAAAFNQNIIDWNTSKVRDMERMFYAAAAFNQNINAWSTGAVETMTEMFYAAAAFNQTISDWDTGSVRYSTDIFVGNSLMTAEQKPIFR